MCPYQVVVEMNSHKLSQQINKYSSGSLSYKQPMGREAQLASKCHFTTTFGGCLRYSPVKQATLTLVYNQGSLVGLSTQDYKSLCAAATICATLDGPKWIFSLHFNPYDLEKYEVKPKKETVSWCTHMKHSASMMNIW